MAQPACFPLTTEAGADGSVQHTLNQLTKIRLADGREVAIVDWSWRPLYTTIDTLNGWDDLELRGFTYAQGDPITVSSNMTVRDTANLMHTNIKVPAQMDSQEEFIVYSIGIEFYRMTEGDGVITATAAQQPIMFPYDMALLHLACIGELEVSEKEYQQASLGWFAPGFGVVSGIATGNASNFTGAQNSEASRDAVDMYPVPVHIGSTENYAFIVHQPTGGGLQYRDLANAEVEDAVIRMRISLHGLHKRPSG